MQKITLFSLLICCAGMYAQEQLLSSIDQFSVGTGNFENAFGYNYEYDANDNLISESGFSWNSSTSQWVPSNRDIYQYNANGRASELTSQVYDSNTDSFVNDFRDLYTYDSNSSPIEVIYQEFINGSYENEFRLTATYSNNNLISFIEYE
ncbi:hypothetical protein SAMN05192588_0958 [Nonlabens sp. Hel1_33_55]|uniref:DUF3836 domain-containing protein n=1 Tax=Nonlabens sp. Hel1_33_55 TaxID=1336802 RepID=UPI000875B5FB|nr:DUF3836 domain-containing protein [Nonlabens sp. Hel1_33_55]SCY06427.1 hypothetical protein SAMN05192588_0958 [Nonlabens sp. Hel1_33_55]